MRKKKVKVADLAVIGGILAVIIIAGVMFSFEVVGLIILFIGFLIAGCSVYLWLYDEIYTHTMKRGLLIGLGVLLAGLIIFLSAL